MKLKLLIYFLFAIAIGYSGYMVASFYFSGNPLTISEFVNYTWQRTEALINKATLFIQEKWQLALTAIGGVFTAVFSLYRAIKSKITNIQQTSQEQIDSINTQASTALNQMQTTITEQNTKIENLQAQVKETEGIQEKLTYAENYAQTLEQQLQIKQAEVNKLTESGTAKRVWQLEETLRQNNIPIPPPSNTETVTVPVIK